MGGTGGWGCLWEWLAMLLLPANEKDDDSCVRHPVVRQPLLFDPGAGCGGWYLMLFVPRTGCGG